MFDNYMPLAVQYTATNFLIINTPDSIDLFSFKSLFQFFFLFVMLKYVSVFFEIVLNLALSLWKFLWTDLGQSC